MIIGWRSPLDNKVYELNDFAALGRAIPEAVLRSMVRKLELDKRHTGTNITITSGLSCPRKLLINRMLPTTPDPSKMWKAQRGTWLHECVGMSLGENDEWITEEKDADACTFAGTLFGIDMSCRVDAIRKDYSVILDWKFRGDGSERWVDPLGRARDTDAAQINMARMLIEQSTHKDLRDMEMYVWVMAGQTIRTTAPYMTEAQVGSMKPAGADYTVAEIFNMLKTSMNLWEAAAQVEGNGDLYAVPESTTQSIIHRLPMVGEKMYNGKGCTQYCEVNEECFAIEGGI